MKALVELALAVTEEERGSNEPERTSAAIREALKAYKTTRQQEASNDIVDLMRLIDSFKAKERRDIKRLRKEADNKVAVLNDLDRRWAFAREKENFLPVLRFFNKISATDLADPDEFDKVTTVPEDFVEKKDTEEE